MCVCKDLFLQQFETPLQKDEPLAANVFLCWDFFLSPKYFLCFNRSNAMNVGYGCKKYIISLKKGIAIYCHRNRLVPFSYTVQFSSPPFPLLKKVLYCSHPITSRILGLIFYIIVLFSATVVCNEQCLHLSSVPRRYISQTMHFSLPKNCMVTCHTVSNHRFGCSVFLILSAWTFASSVLVCNNQTFLYGGDNYLFTLMSVWIRCVRG